MNALRYVIEHVYMKTAQGNAAPNPIKVVKLVQQW